jgi:hypothetical protein
MPGFQRDEALIAELRRRPSNQGVLDTVEGSSAHGDLGEVLFHYAASTGGMRVVPLRTEAFPALVATAPDDDQIVAAASGMRWLLIRAGDEAPTAVRLAHDAAPDVGPEWWRVYVFDPEVSRRDIDTELQRWFDAAAQVNRA